MIKISIFRFAIFGINTYVLTDEATSDCIVVDPGMSSHEEEDVMINFIESNHLHLKYIVATHLHLEHAVGIEALRRRYGVELLAHEADAPLGERLKEQAKMFGVRVNIISVTPGRYIKDGDILEIGESRLEVIHVSGHSPGHIALYDRADQFLVSGDILFAGSIGRTDLPGGSSTQLISGIRNKLMTLPDDTVVYPGHGPTTTIGVERRSNPYIM